MHTLPERMQRDVYDLLTATRHDLPAQQLTGAEWDVYRQGYDYALIIVLRVLQAAAIADEICRRTARRLARQAALERRRQARARRVIIGRECSFWEADRGDFCRAPAQWMRVNDAGAPIDLQCREHKTAVCQLIPVGEQEADTGPGFWAAQRRPRLSLLPRGRGFFG